MANIVFTPADWERVRRDYDRWWDGTLERPLVSMTVHGMPAARERSAVPLRGVVPDYPDEATAEGIVDSWDDFLARTRFLGDAYPRQLLNFGPGALAAVLGARAEAANGTVWFHPPEMKEIAALDFPGCDLGHPWVKRMEALIGAAEKRWGATVALDMTDMGGVFDVLQVFRPGEGLLLDLYDAPEDVARCAGRIEAAWWRLWEHVTERLRAAGFRNYGSWGGLLSYEPHYLFQNDFAYMIGPESFREHLLPQLSRDFARVPRAFYHLDGPGQINHLEMLLEVGELKGIQWVPGSGQPVLAEWSDMIARILAAGKRVQVVAPADRGDPFAQFEELLAKLGTGKGLQLFWSACAENEIANRVRRLERLGVPAGAV